MDLKLELEYEGIIVAGVDEAGRGPLAGPVVAAAVILDRSNIPEGIKDSKKLSAGKRESLYKLITGGHIFAVGIVPPDEIDRINILEATKKACTIAVSSLPITPEVVLVDGNMRFEDGRFISIIKGDNKSLSIAAASIIAKVTRDRIMHRLAPEHPNYGWQQNAGYGTKSHLEAIRIHGLSEHHRRSFQPKSLK